MRRGQPQIFRSPPFRYTATVRPSRSRRPRVCVIVHLLKSCVVAVRMVHVDFRPFGVPDSAPGSLPLVLGTKACIGSRLRTFGGFGLLLCAAVRFRPLLLLTQEPQVDPGCEKPQLPAPTDASCPQTAAPNCPVDRFRSTPRSIGRLADLQPSDPLTHSAPLPASPDRFPNGRDSRFTSCRRRGPV